MPQEVPVRAFAISAFICRGQGEDTEVLLLRRTGQILNGIWCQVAGGIEAGEAAWQAALREIREETGLVPERLYSANILEQFYEADRECISLIPVFVGFINSDQNVELNDEHSEYAWLTFREAEERLPFAGQRAVLRHVEREFVRRAPNELLRITPDAAA